MTSQFRSYLETRDLNREGKGVRLLLLSNLIYDSELLDRPVIVPAGFVTDLASIPRALWGIIPPIGRYDDAAVVHDFLYQRGGVTRGQADGTLREAMKACSVRESLRFAIWSGVRVGGFVTWNRYRRADESGDAKVV